MPRQALTMTAALLFSIGLTGCAVSVNDRAVGRPTAQHFGASALPFSEAVQAGDMLYLSGQIGVAPGTTALVPGGIEGETRQTMENIRGVLSRRGLDFDDVVKCTVMLADMRDWPAFNSVYVGYFTAGRLPARSAFGANGLAYGGRIELECWAYNPQ
ncbi:MAG: RidA family protein [Sphingopyxis sp.]